MPKTLVALVGTGMIAAVGIPCAPAGPWRSHGSDRGPDHGPDHGPGLRPRL